MSFWKKKTEPKEFDRENLKPVIRCSICTGEKTAGFRDLRTDRFHEVCLIRTDRELQQFLEEYGIDTITEEY